LFELFLGSLMFFSSRSKAGFGIAPKVESFVLALMPKAKFKPRFPCWANYQEKAAPIKMSP
jgi:hypothetical protein